ncbi:hypothetical protein [Rhodococcus qingshengii]|jgi:plasmid maintenance system antidote protein VapI|uniref:hypothetical protein n=1 Tax=Rhodococcus qingshengii TaxID=334542 RepID=UPI0009F1F9EA|nr:hypothetical protein [Rhodococcus qingshengii]ORC17753.1 hypothetical protein BXO91_27060 [Rhodococcus qingshengii]
MTDARTAVERAQLRADLMHNLQSIADRLRINEAQHAELLSERTKIAKELKDAGAKTEELQEVLGVTKSRVHQLLRGAGT